MKDDKTKEKDFKELKDEDLDQVAGGTSCPEWRPALPTLQTLDTMMDADKNNTAQVAQVAQAAQVTEEAKVEESIKFDDNLVNAWQIVRPKIPGADL